MDWTLALGALVVGVAVGLTGMGGGALMTPMLVLFFGVQPLAAVSSDLAASAIMKPVGAAVHFRHGTVRVDMVRWLCFGSVPCAFCGVLIARALGTGDTARERDREVPGALVRRALAFVLLASALKLFGVDTVVTGVVLVVIAVLAGPIWMLLRRRHGFPAWPRNERQEAETVSATP